MDFPTERATRLPTVRVRGLDFLDLSGSALASLLRKRLRAGERTLVFTPNADIGAQANASPALHALLARADLLLPDGAGVLLASRLHAPRPLRHRLAGIEAGEAVLHICAQEGIPVFFLGGRPTVAERAARRWRERLPSLPVVGTHDGYFSHTGDENDRVTETIRASGARVLLVCLGFPAQERWIVQNADALPGVQLLMGLGGSLDVWSGDLRRAPRAFQTAHLEWLWRICRQPRRLRALPRMLNYVFCPNIRKK